MNADLLVPSLSQTKLLSYVMRQFQLVDLVCQPTRVTMSSSSQIDVLLTTDAQCFDSTAAFPFLAVTIISSSVTSMLGVSVLILHLINLLLL